MKTLKNILFITVFAFLITGCTDTTEDLIINKKDTIENTVASAKLDTGDGEGAGDESGK